MGSNPTLSATHSEMRDGTIQRFEFTTELAWKTVREYLLNEGMTDINTPKSVMKEAFAAGVIDDEQGWLQILNDRNGTSHIYDESRADAVLAESAVNISHCSKNWN